MIKAWRALLLLGGMLGIGFAANGATTPLPWVKFQWGPLTSGGKIYKHGALLVPIHIRSHTKTYYMQLDTGAPGTIFYAVPKPVQEALLGGWHKGEPFTLPLHIGQTAITFSGIRIVKSPSADMKGPYPIIGTLGQNAFQNLVVFIDFVHQRITFIRPARVTGSDLAGISFIPLTVHDEELFIPVTISGIFYSDGFFYDSGSSLLPLLTKRTVWKRLVGRSPDMKRDAVMHVNQWGKMATLVGARIPGRLSIGPLTQASPMAWVQISGGRKGSDLDGQGPAVKGIIGNAPFTACCMIVIDATNKRFGIRKLH